MHKRKVALTALAAVPVLRSAVHRFLGLQYSEGVREKHVIRFAADLERYEAQVTQSLLEALARRSYWSRFLYTSADREGYIALLRQQDAERIIRRLRRALHREAAVLAKR